MLREKRQDVVESFLQVFVVSTIGQKTCSCRSQGFHVPRWRHCWHRCTTCWGWWSLGSEAATRRSRCTKPSFGSLGRWGVFSRVDLLLLLRGCHYCWWHNSIVCQLTTMTMMTSVTGVTGTIILEPKLQRYIHEHNTYYLIITSSINNEFHEWWTFFITIGELAVGSSRWKL